MNNVKRMNYKRKLISYCVILSVFFSSFLMYSPASIAQTEPGTPVVEVFSPVEGASFDEAMVEFTGKVYDDVTAPDKLMLKVLEKDEQTEASIDITSEGTLSTVDENGNWSFSKVFGEGVHKVTFVVEDETGQEDQAVLTFTINGVIAEAPTLESDESKETNQDKVSEELAQPNAEAVALATTEVDTENRPIVKSIELMAYDKNSEEGGPRTPDSPMAFTNSEDYKSKAPIETDEPIGETSDRLYKPAEDLSQVRLNTQIRLTIKEAGSLTISEPLFLISADELKKVDGKKVPLTIISNVKDSDQPYHTIILDPTEDLTAGKTYYLFVNPAVKNDQNLNIITKSLRFTTRPDKHSVDLHGDYGNNTNSCANCHSTHNGQTATLMGGAIVSDPSGEFCMVCHDGTNGPITESYDTNNDHYKAHTQESLKGEGFSCASCHNPHTSWTKENPNKIKNHDSNTYSKTLGTSDDFKLCLRCHTAGKASDMEIYYKDAEILASSGHNFSKAEGSTLDGQMPCADCHETHGSNNSYSLKENLGHVIRSTEDEKFKQEPGARTLSAVEERNFCLSCHNGSIEMYGKTARYDDKIEEHLDESGSCSSCHGTGDNKSQTAAHAPRKLGTVE